MNSEKREILLQAEREREREGWIPEHTLGDSELWTFKLVKAALVDAYRMLRRVGGQVGPGRLKAAWPTSYDPRDYPPEKSKTSPYRMGMTVTRMEMVVLGWTDEDRIQHSSWLAGALLTVPEYREKLEAWVFAELRGESSIDLCYRMKWPLRTMQWQRDKAAGIVADRLNRAGVTVW